MHTLTIFAREPVPGRTKTRLCPPFAPHSAAAPYACLLCAVCYMAVRLPDVQIGITYTSDSDPSFFTSFAPNTLARPQREATLGERMDHALHDALHAASVVGCPSSAVLIGSDSPDLPVAHLHQTFAQLAAGADVVLGPASDGGYYLIGVRQPQLQLLRDVPMSTSTVLADTLVIASAMQLQVHVLPLWYDIDTAEDVWDLRERLSSTSADGAPATRQFMSQLELDRTVPSE